jgi:Flp pilus assembly pilin Flp
LISGPPHGRLRVSRRAEQGLTAIEYALVVAVAAVLLAGGVYYLFSGVQARFIRNEQCATSAWEGARAEC